MDYATAVRLLEGRDSKKVANNTYLERGVSSIGLRLHQTTILRYCEDGSVEYDSGGWRTMTTRERMDRFGPLAIYTVRGVWYVARDHRRSEIPLGVFADGMVWHPAEERLEGAAKDNKAIILERRRIASYAERYMAALEDGKVPAPGPGDCWYCYMRTQSGAPLGEGTDAHVRKHVKENCYVPSLLTRALEVHGARQTMLWWVGSFWDQSASEEQRASARQLGERARVQKALRKYVMRQLGHAI
jgi:hypothetical protein